MSDAAKSQDDLSIEEILGSIRRIIAEDDDENMPQQAGAKTGETETVLAEPQPEPSQAEPPQDDSGFSDMEDDEEEPLILTNRIESENEQHISLEENEQDAASVLIHDDMADILEEEKIISGSEQEPVQEESVQEKSNEPTARTETAIPADSPVKEDISTMTNSQDDATLDATLKDNALLSSNAAIATAAVMAKLARQAAITEEGNGNVTIEAMVKEMIRPMLREWLDANLPDLVQKMVERELERLTKRL